MKKIKNGCYIPFVFTVLCNADAEAKEGTPKSFSLKINDKQTLNASYRRKNVSYIWFYR